MSTNYTLNQVTKFILSSCSCLLFSPGFSQSARPERIIELQSVHGRSIVFYNVENAFDTIDDPSTNDADFLPAGKLKWTGKRYRLKLKHLSAAITLNLAENPVLIGFAEIENSKVLMDLAKTGKLATTHYLPAHKESPDPRGIDCGLLYDSDRFKPLIISTLAVRIDSVPDFKTRDILYVKGELQEQQLLHVFVNHWPSRRGGEEESDHKRARAAEVLHKKVAEILAEDPTANILLMGDFNDHPADKSIFQVLGAKPATYKQAGLVNLMYDDQLVGKGTHCFDGKWGILDQFIVSSGFYNNTTGLQIMGNDAKIVSDKMLLFTPKNGTAKPSTTYSGSTYHGGYSDHLPIRLELK